MTNINRNLIFIIILLSIAAFFRFYLLEERGLFEWDEGYYIQLVSTYRAGFDYFFKTKLLGQDLGQIGEYLLTQGGAFRSAFKDGFTYFILLTSIIFGMNHNTIIYSNALIGTLTVLLLYVFLKKSICNKYAFIIALGLAVSPYHTAFSRGGMPVIFAGFFLIISIGLYLIYYDDNNRLYGLLSGIFLGLAFSCHYILGIFVVTIFCFEFCRCIFTPLESIPIYGSGAKSINQIPCGKGKPFLTRLTPKNYRRFLLFFVGFSLPLLILELFSRIIKQYITIKLQALSFTMSFVTYFQKAFQQFCEAKAGEKIQNPSPFFYLNSLISQEGVIIILCAVFMLGVLFFKRKCRLKNTFIIWVFLAPFLIITFSNTKADRLLLSFLPILYLLIGYGLSCIRGSKGEGVFIIIFFIAICINAHRSLDLFNYTSNFGKAVEFMKENKGVKHISDDMYVSRAYVNRQNAIDDFISLDERNGRVSLEKVKDFFSRGYNYLLLYDKPYHLNDLTKTALTQVADFSIPSIGNNNESYRAERCLLRDKKDKPARYIYVYSLEKIIKLIKE